MNDDVSKSSHQEKGGSVTIEKVDDLLMAVKAAMDSRYEEITLFIDLSKERVSTMGIVLPKVLTLRICSLPL